MNRLEAAKRIRGRIIIEREQEFQVIEFTYPELGNTRRLMTYTESREFPEKDIIWTRISSRDVLKLIRNNYPRRIEGQCDHKYEMWSKSGRELIGHAKCTVTQEHFHCASCEASETGIGVCRDLCFNCQKEADKVRRELTGKILDFEAKFGIGFQEDRYMRDMSNGDMDERSYHGHRGEDFHADC